MKVEDKLKHFSKYTMDEARKNCDEMLEKYRAALEQVFEEHKETKIRMEELEYRTERERIVKENNKRFSDEQMKIRMTLSHRQAELKNKLFEEVEEHLRRFRKTPAYEELLVRELKAAAAFARGEEVIFYIDPSDEEKVPRLEAEAGVPVTVSAYSFVGGMRAVIPGRNILIDNSFASKLAEAREKITIRSGGEGQEKTEAEPEDKPDLDPA